MRRLRDAWYAPFLALFFLTIVVPLVLWGALSAIPTQSRESYQRQLSRTRTEVARELELKRVEDAVKGFLDELPTDGEHACRRLTPAARRALLDATRTDSCATAAEILYRRSAEVGSEDLDFDAIHLIQSEGRAEVPGAPGAKTGAVRLEKTPTGWRIASLDWYPKGRAR